MRDCYKMRYKVPSQRIIGKTKRTVYASKMKSSVMKIPQMNTVVLQSGNHELGKLYAENKVEMGQNTVSFT